MMEWRVSELFPVYEISEVGDVRRCKPEIRTGDGVGRVMTRTLHKGYHRYALWDGVKQRHIKACRLVIEAFVGPSPFKGAEICHGDGNKTNDHYTNLRWDTHKSNMMDRSAHGFRGTRCHTAKLTESQVIEIRRLLANGESKLKVSKTFGVGHTAIRGIASGVTWRHVP